MMNKYLITYLISSLVSLSCASLHAQQDNNSHVLTHPDDDTIGGIGGTGIRSMNRPEILERPERIERPEILESRDAMEDILEVDSAIDLEGSKVESPEPMDNPSL